MNPSLKALKTRLTMQQQELEQHLYAIEKESQQLEQQLQTLEDNLMRSSPASLLINPEMEINKLNFLIQQQEKKAQLQLLLKEQQALELQLKEKLLRVQTELKMLERYLEKTYQALEQQHLIAQEHRLDEWVLQQKDRL